MVDSKPMKLSWRYAGGMILFLLLLTAALYQQTIKYLATRWNDLSVGEYGHGYLVLAICVFLIFSNRKQLFEIVPCPSYKTLPLVLLSSLVWLVAIIVDVEMLQSVGLLFLVLSVIWTVTGYKALKLLAFPLLFLVFALPVWFPLSPLLQDFTADVVFAIIRLLEIPAFRQENEIVLPAGIFSIEEACSGLRYLLAALTLGSLYAYLNYTRTSARLAVVLIAAAAAILANILRVFIVVYVGYTTEMQHPWISDHLMLGWYLFGAVVVIMLFIDARLYRNNVAPEDSVVVNKTYEDSCEKSIAQAIAITFICAIMLSVGPITAYRDKNLQFSSDPNTRVALPEVSEGWHGPVESQNDWMPKYNGAISQKMDYQDQTDTVSLYVGYYSQQRQGEEVINVKNHISDDDIWRRQYTRARNRRLNGYDVKEQLIENGQAKKRLIWYWYVIGGWVTTNNYEAKVLQLAAAINNKAQAYVVAVSVDVDGNIENARETLHQFISVMKDPLGDIQVIEKADDRETL